MHTATQQKGGLVVRSAATMGSDMSIGLGSGPLCTGDCRKSMVWHCAFHAPLGCCSACFLLAGREFMEWFAVVVEWCVRGWQLATLFGLYGCCVTVLRPLGSNGLKHCGHVLWLARPCCATLARTQRRS